MACSSCGGGRSSGGSPSPSRRREAWRIVHTNGAVAEYLDESRARRDHEAHQQDPRTQGSRLERIDPITKRALPA